MRRSGKGMDGRGMGVGNAGVQNIWRCGNELLSGCRGLCNVQAMPIERRILLRELSQEEFDHLDAVVMSHAYASQNKLGRLFDERVYENEMAAALWAAGCEFHTQVPVKVVHRSFQKTYYFDLVVNDLLYELKTVATLVSEHEAQALHYAMLGGTNRAKLIDFRAGRVQGKLCYNPLADLKRSGARFQTSDWRPKSAACELLLRHLHNVIADWGTHLSFRLYNEAMVHFSGGEARCLQRVSVGALGTHVVQSHAPGWAFLVTGVTSGIADFRTHLSRLISHLDLTGMHWFNFNHAMIACETLESES